MTPRAVEIILDTIRASLHLHIGTVQYVNAAGEEGWRLGARDNDGQRWAAENPDYYRAAVKLAELVGFDLKNG